MLSSTGIKRSTMIFMGALFAVLSMGAMGESFVTKGSKAAGLGPDGCVAPKAEMRRNHMDYLKHDRVATVRQGIRDTKASLASCVDCHAADDGKGGYAPVNGEGQFCESCHSYVGVNLYFACFQCHRKTPQAESASLSDSEIKVGAFALQLDADKQHAVTAQHFSKWHSQVVED
ncbi:MAG: sulfur reduction protein DsrJ [Candidatus Sedimenticola sp. (ex Thyasira tokunagai)]